MDGFIVKVFDRLIIFFQKISLVEYLKKIFIRISKVSDKNDKIKVANLVIDIFIVTKWIFILFMFIGRIQSMMTNVIIIYLLIMNIHTYFYYHLWTERAIIGIARSVEHYRRRFISLILAIGYNIISYAYIYNIGFEKYFSYTKPNNHWVSSVLHSFSSTFTGGSNFITPKDDIGLFIQTSQILISFIFVGIILSKSDSLKGE